MRCLSGRCRKRDVLLLRQCPAGRDGKQIPSMQKHGIRRRGTVFLLCGVVSVSPGFRRTGESLPFPGENRICRPHDLWQAGQPRPEGAGTEGQQKYFLKRTGPGDFCAGRAERKDRRFPPCKNTVSGRRGTVFLRECECEIRKISC